MSLRWLYCGVVLVLSCGGLTAQQAMTIDYSWTVEFDPYHAAPYHYHYTGTLTVTLEPGPAGAALLNHAGGISGGAPIYDVARINPGGGGSVSVNFDIWHTGAADLYATVSICGVENGIEDPQKWKQWGTVTQGAGVGVYDVVPATFTMGAGVAAGGAFALSSGGGGGGGEPWDPTSMDGKQAEAEDTFAPLANLQSTDSHTDLIVEDADASGFNMDMPLGPFGTINLPVGDWLDMFRPALAAFRLFATLYIAWQVLQYMVADMHGKVVALGAVQQSRGHSVAGSGGQATGFIAAGIITALLIAAVSGGVTWLVSLGLPGGGDIVSSFTDVADGGVSILNTVSTLAGWLIVNAFPLVGFIWGLVTLVAYHTVGAMVHFGVSTAIRWVVP